MCPSATDASNLKFVQLLEGIGALSKADSKKAKSRSGNYQDSAVAPLDREYDNEAVQQEDEEKYEDKSSATASGRPDGIILAVAKVMSFLPSP
jgi:hypothetical protein